MVKDDLAAVMGRSQGWSQKHHGPSCNFMSLALGCVSSFNGEGGGQVGFFYSSRTSKKRPASKPTVEEVWHCLVLRNGGCNVRRDSCFSLH